MTLYIFYVRYIPFLKRAKILKKQQMGKFNVSFN